jgi:ABC-type sugar transport system permease subunit/ABC-type glycerol-3-phosphate transport system substrate-binding protein
MVILGVIAPVFIEAQSPPPKSPNDPINLKVFKLPSKQATVPHQAGEYRVMERFLELNPKINLTSTTALSIQGERQDTAPLMAIAAKTSPDVIQVNFRRSDTYISQGFLYPLDEYIAQVPKEELEARIPPSLKPVVYREGPDGKMHYYAVPISTSSRVLMYRRDLFAMAGLDPDRPPQTWEEMMEYAEKLTDPARGVYGITFASGQHASWDLYPFLVSAGAQAVKQLPSGEWRAAFDTPEAVDAFEFVDELQKKTVTKDGKTVNICFRSASEGSGARWTEGKIAMVFKYLEDSQFGNFDPQLIGVAPAPRAPGGGSSSELNASMLGIFAGQTSKEVRDAAWKYIWYMGSPEAKKVYTQTMVEQGAWRMLNPAYLREFGYPELAKLTTPGLEEAFEVSVKQGTPEPYGKNCQYIYTYMTSPIEQIFFTDFTRKNKEGKDVPISREEKRAKIQEIIAKAVQVTNEKMIGVVDPEVRKKRNFVGWIVAVAGAAAFIFLITRIFRWMNVKRPPRTEETARRKDIPAMMLIAPALLLIAMWQYWPLVRGSIIAFQDYNLMGNSQWVGISNFADIIYDGRFWLSLKNAFYFCILWLLLGFIPPVMLAVLLQEIPVGKVFFRVLYYIPAVVSGIVILFMWRGIYDPSPDGVLNKIVAMFGIEQQTWLNDPAMAMLCVVFPLAWAHFGPGCIIYLAALKSVPDELYEASDIDGASFWGKLRYIVFPYLKPLLVINMVGATIHGFNSGNAILAMTGGGPNMATHVVGYEIFQRTFMYLQFGHGTAMAWVLGILLLSFTAYQMKILNKVEFRTANK